MERYGGLPWMILLVGVPKEGLQRLCADNGLPADRTKDELIDQIAGLRTVPRKARPLRSWGNRWTR
jgi:hypothetical protein